jgi:hypothetical protein
MMSRDAVSGWTTLCSWLSLTSHERFAADWGGGKDIAVREDVTVDVDGGPAPQGARFAVTVLVRSHSLP